MRGQHRPHLSEGEAAKNLFQLDNEDGGTWHRRTKSSADEMPRPRAYRRHQAMNDVVANEDDLLVLPQKAAVKKSDELKRKATLRFSFGRWKGYAVRVRSQHRLLTRQAEDFDRDMLARDALFLWHEKSEANRMSMLKAEAANNLLLKEGILHKWLERWELCMHDVDEYVCERVRLAAWRGWRRRMLHDEGKAIHWKLGRGMDRWRASTRITQEREQQVQVLHARALCRLYLIAWKYHLDQKKALLLHEESVRNQAWRFWRFRVKNEILQGERAELLLESDLINRYVPKWARKIKAHMELQDMAIVHYDLAAQGRWVRTWRVACVLKQKLRVYSTKKTIPIQRVFLQRWNDYYFENGIADNCRYRVIAKQYLRIWHERFKERQWTAQVNANFLYTYFTKWAHGTTLKQFKETLTLNLLRRTLRSWVSRTVELEEIDERAESRYIQNIRPKQLRFWLYALHECFLLHLQTQQQAIVRFSYDGLSNFQDHDEVFVLSNRISQWKSAASATRQLVKDNELIADNHFTTLTFSRWHNLLLTKQETQRQSKLVHLLNTQLKRKLIQSYNLWHKNMIVRKHLEHQADEFYASLEQENAFICISRWRHRKEELHHYQVEAVAFSDKTVLQRYLGYIRDAQNDVLKLQLVAEEESAARDQATHAQLIRSWRMRLFKSRGFDMQAQLFKERSKGLLIREYYRNWCAKTILKKTPPHPRSEECDEGNTTAEMIFSTPSRPPRNWPTSTPRNRIRGSAIRLGI